MREKTPPTEKEIPTEVKKRLQFDFTEDAIEEIDELQRLTKLPTRVEAIRYALRFLRWAVDETNEGGTLCLERDGRIREIIPFWQPTNGRKAKKVAANEAASRNGQ